MKLLRTIAGIALVMISTAFLIQGGLSRYAAFGVPAHPDWRMIAIGLAMMAAGVTCIRPGWWRKFTRAA